MFTLTINQTDSRRDGDRVPQLLKDLRHIPARLDFDRSVEDEVQRIFGGDFINATTVALLVLSLMVMTRIVDWDDVLAHKQAWNVLVWFATLVTMADGLNKVGFLKWFAGGAATALGGYSVMTVLVALTLRLPQLENWSPCSPWLASPSSA